MIMKQNKRACFTKKQLTLMKGRMQVRCIGRPERQADQFQESETEVKIERMTRITRPGSRCRLPAVFSGHRRGPTTQRAMGTPLDNDKRNEQFATMQTKPSTDQPFPMKVHSYTPPKKKWEQTRLKIGFRLKIEPFDPQNGSEERSLARDQ
jgi:hypothetical protein